MSKIKLITPLHQSSTRDYLARMTTNKPVEMQVASHYSQDYWDGDRRFGYGGYRYDGRWAPVAERLIERYQLTKKSSVLDLGCGKAHLLLELKKKVPGLRVVGLDISSYAIESAPAEIQSSLHPWDLREMPLPYSSKEFDLVLSLNTLHNLHIEHLFPALKEIERVGRDQFIVVESYRNEQELMNLQCWALTCASFYSESDWEWVFENQGYKGDYEFIFFE